MPTPSEKTVATQTPAEQTVARTPGLQSPPYPGQPGHTTSTLSPPSVDPEVIALHDALAFTLHGADPSNGRFPLFWDGSDQAGKGLASIQKALDKAVQPARPEKDLPPGSSGTKQGGA